MSDEMAEIQQRANGAMTGVVMAAGQLAQVMIQAQIEAARRASQMQQMDAEAERARIRARHQLDSAVWQPAMKPQWWRDAGAEDIAQVWRAASAWQHVDPRAEAARQVVAERLAERGMHIDASAAPAPVDVEWLSDGLDRAATEQAAARAAGRNAPDPGRREASVEGDVLAQPGDLRAGELSARQEMAAHVQAVWSPERAARVTTCEAWPVLADKLHELQNDGHDVRQLLGGVSGFVDRAHTPAAYVYRTVEDAARGMVDLGVASRERGLGEGERASQRDARDRQLVEERTETDPAGVGHDRVEQARADESRHAAAANEHELRAATAEGQALQAGAEAVAQAYPATTQAAVTATATAAAGRRSQGQAAGRAAVTSTRPAVIRRPRAPRER
jgi:hypothetical protein